MEFETLKKHLRVDSSFEDELILDYQRWAEEEIKDSVSTEVLRNEDFFIDNAHFDRAVFLLVAHYFENRVGYSEKALQNAPDGILSAVHKLRAAYTPIVEVVTVD